VPPRCFDMSLHAGWGAAGPSSEAVVSVMMMMMATTPTGQDEGSVSHDCVDWPSEAEVVPVA
jgi:hypothetical protein